MNTLNPQKVQTLKNRVERLVLSDQAKIEKYDVDT